VDPSRGYPFPDELQWWQQPRILDLASGTVVAAVPTSDALLGWYDDTHVVRVGPQETTTFEVVDVITGAVTERVAAPGLPKSAEYQLGYACGLRGDGFELGF
jgi:hypothetical protein